MDNASPNSHTSKCPFCRMQSESRLMNIPVCAICRDQLYDFAWVSGVQAVVTLLFNLGGIVFIVQEILLFAVLIFVKHRFTPPWEKSHRHH